MTFFSSKKCQRKHNNWRIERILLKFKFQLGGKKSKKSPCKKRIRSAKKWRNWFCDIQFYNCDWKLDKNGNRCPDGKSYFVIFSTRNISNFKTNTMKNHPNIKWSYKINMKNCAWKVWQKQWIFVFDKFGGNTIFMKVIDAITLTIRNSDCKINNSPVFPERKNYRWKSMPESVPPVTLTKHKIHSLIFFNIFFYSVLDTKGYTARSNAVGTRRSRSAPWRWVYLSVNSDDLRI